MADEDVVLAAVGPGAALVLRVAAATGEVVASSVARLDDPFGGLPPLIAERAGRYAGGILAEGNAAAADGERVNRALLLDAGALQVPGPGVSAAACSAAVAGRRPGQFQINPNLVPLCLLYIGKYIWWKL